MDDYLADEVARRARLEVLYGGKACARCGASDVELLEGYSRIDLHHVAGRGNDPDLVVYLCRNCHAEAHAHLKETGAVDLSPPPERNLLEVVATVLVALGTTLVDFGQQLLVYGERLLALIGPLDEHHAGWRGLAEARP